MAKSHTTKSGRFGVRRRPDGGLEPYHVDSGLKVGEFSHIAVRTFEAAIEGLEAAESTMSGEHLRLIDEIPCAGMRFDHTVALRHLVGALQRSFPNGAWSH